jgi:hypothetical protein
MLDIETSKESGLSRIMKIRVGDEVVFERPGGMDWFKFSVFFDTECDVTGSAFFMGVSAARSASGGWSGQGLVLEPDAMGHYRRLGAATFHFDTKDAVDGFIDCLEQKRITIV